MQTQSLLSELNRKIQVLRKTIYRVLWKLSSDDCVVIESCSKKTQEKFSAIGGLVLLICLTSFLSVFYLISQMYQSIWVGLPIAVFFSWMFTNMYILLLYTLTRNPFPSNVKTYEQVFSVVVRFIFIGLLAILVSKPLEVYLLHDDLQKDVLVYKQDKLADFKVSIDSFFNSEIKILTKLLQIQDQDVWPSELSPNANLAERLDRIQRKKESLMRAMEKRISLSTFFLYRLTLVATKYRLGWVLTVIIIAIFYLPAIIKFLIPKESEYNTTKKAWEIAFVKSEYEHFTKKYNLINELAGHPDKKWVEHYVDAPFNTQRIDRSLDLESEVELIAYIYGELDS